VEVRSAPVGYVAVVCLGGSDTMVSVPFHRREAWRGRLAGVPVVAGGVGSLELAGSPGLEAGALVAAPHYLIFGEGSGREGEWYEVVGNGEGTVEIDVGGGDLAGVGEDDVVAVVPHWILDVVLPPGVQATAHVSGGKLLTERGTELLFFDNEGEGIRLAPARKFFLTAGGWLEAVEGFPAAGGVVVAPGQLLVVRHPEGFPSTVFTSLQRVFMGGVVLPVRGSGSGRQDTAVAVPRPVPVKLGELDLGEGVFGLSASTAEGDRGDELLVFDGAEAAINREPTAVYFRTAGGWVKDEEGFPAADEESLEVSQGLVVRKAAGGDGTSLRWLNLPRY
jgi:uncharacterized protein (TIGR02597 family)